MANYNETYDAVLEGYLPGPRAGHACEIEP